MASRGRKHPVASAVIAAGLMMTAPVQAAHASHHEPGIDTAGARPIAAAVVHEREAGRDVSDRTQHEAGTVERSASTHERASPQEPPERQVGPHSSQADNADDEAREHSRAQPDAADLQEHENEERAEEREAEKRFEERGKEAREASQHGARTMFEDAERNAEYGKREEDEKQVQDRARYEQERQRLAEEKRQQQEEERQRAEQTKQLEEDRKRSEQQAKDGRKRQSGWGWGR